MGEVVDTVGHKSCAEAGHHVTSSANSCGEKPLTGPSEPWLRHSLLLVKRGFVNPEGGASSLGISARPAALRWRMTP